MSKRFKILVVDDEPVNIQVVTSALENSYDIISALDGYEAIDQIKACMPDLILLDVMLPDINGFDICKVIKSNDTFADIPIIFLSALDSRESLYKGLDYGGIDYLTKPVDIDLLKLRVRNHMESKERHDLVKEQRDVIAKQKEELEAILARVKQLEGIIPICMYCKKIRDDQKAWNQLEVYITNHSEAIFSHGVCPDCLEAQIEIINNLIK